MNNQTEVRTNNLLNAAKTKLEEIIQQIIDQCSERPDKTSEIAIDNVVAILEGVDAFKPLLFNEDEDQAEIAFEAIATWVDNAITNLLKK
jgi:hypothetical protein